MPFCLGSRLTANQPLAEYLKTAAGYFRAIELNADPKYLSPYFNFDANQKNAIRIYQKRYQFRLTLHAPFINCRLGAINPEERRLAQIKLIHSLQLASDLEIKLVTFHPSSMEPDAPEKLQENNRYEEESIAALLRDSRRLGVMLLIENMPALPHFHPATRDGSRFQELLWLFPDDPFGLTIDIGHALQAQVSLDSLLAMNRIRHFHFHENDRHTDSHLPITANLTWWRKLTGRLGKDFPDAVAILEMDQLADQLKTLQNLNCSSRRNRRVINLNLEELIGDKR
jgi:sugar phosphate isomerase/epimerase